MKSRLDQKSIVVIGGTSGLGLSAALACAAEGAHVMVVGRDESKCRDAHESISRASNGAICQWLAADAMHSQTAETAIKRLIAETGRLDGLYHVAGGSGRRQGDGPLDATSNEGWSHTLDFNLTSLFYSNRAAVRQFLLQGGGGSVLNMSSVLAGAPSPHHFATHTYAAAKAGANGLTVACAAYYASQGIRFNVVAPALVETPLSQRALGDDEIMQYVRTKQPLDGGRVGIPSDLDAAVVFFLSDESKFVTGQVLAVDGGWSITDGQHNGGQRE